MRGNIDCRPWFWTTTKSCPRIINLVKSLSNQYHIALQHPVFIAAFVSNDKKVGIGTLVLPLIFAIPTR